MSDLETFILRTWVVLQPLIIRALCTVAAGLCVWVLGFYLLLNPFKEPLWPVMRYSLLAFRSVVLFFGSKIKNLIVWGLLGLSLAAFLATFLMLLGDVTNVMLLLRTLTAGLCVWLLSFYISSSHSKSLFGQSCTKLFALTVRYSTLSVPCSGVGLFGGRLGLV